MNKSIRKERFIRVSSRRVDAAISAINALENLSNKNNYEWNQSEIDEISGSLMAQIKLVMAAFGSSSASERYQKLIEQDRLQLKLLEQSDPEVFKLATAQLHGKKLPIELKLDKNESELLNQFRKLYEELIKISLSSSNKLSSIEHDPNDFFITDPRFNLSRLTAAHNHDRLEWMQFGKTLREIQAKDSPYSNQPSGGSSLSHLTWDIKQGRVIQDSKNILFI